LSFPFGYETPNKALHIISLCSKSEIGVGDRLEKRRPCGLISNRVAIQEGRLARLPECPLLFGHPHNEAAHAPTRPRGSVVFHHLVWRSTVRLRVCGIPGVATNFANHRFQGISFRCASGEP